nr:uncharacterized protein LOC125184651 isoform X2 [Anser cygnoides]
MHGECTDTYPIEGTSEVDREILNGSRQKSACGNMTSGTEALHLNMTERLEKVEKDLRLMERKCTAWCDDFESRLRLLENCNRAFPGRVTQKEPEDKEENRKMKEKIKQLKARNHELLSKLMSMHKQSENMNDPSRLSAVLHLYEMVRLHDWEKCRKSSTNMTYTNGRNIIKKLFDACEEYIEKRKNDIFNVLDISSLNYAYESQEFANCKQELMPIVTELLRNAYCQRYSDFNKIITEVSKDTAQKQGQRFSFLVMSAQFGTKQDRSFFCLELFSTCREGLLARILPYIPPGMHRDTCNLPKTASGAVRNGRRGRAVPSLTRVQSYQVSRAGLVMVIRVSHRVAITRQAHSDGAR